MKKVICILLLGISACQSISPAPSQVRSESIFRRIPPLPPEPNKKSEYTEEESRALKVDFIELGSLGIQIQERWMILRPTLVKALKDPLIKEDHFDAIFKIMRVGDLVTEKLSIHLVDLEHEIKNGDNKAATKMNISCVLNWIIYAHKLYGSFNIKGKEHIYGEPLELSPHVKRLLKSDLNGLCQEDMDL